MKLRRKQKPVRLVIRNGIGMEIDVLDLTPGNEVTIRPASTYVVCDRGFGSDDNRHRLTEREYGTVLRLEVQR